MMKKGLIILFLSVACVANTFAQKTVFDYNTAGNYEIGAIRVEGNQFTDAGALVSISGLKVGDKIKFPGEEIPRAIRKLWKLRLFTDIQVDIDDKIGDVLKLVITVQELPRLARYSYTGVKKAKHDDLNDAVTGHLHKGGIVTENVKVNATTAIRAYFIDKGFLDAEVAVREVSDTILQNAVRLVFDIDKGEKVKIQDIVFTGNDNVKESKLRKLMENTSRKKRIFKSSKFIKKDYETDKETIIAYYNTVGFRDALITKDSMFRLKNEEGIEEDMVIALSIDEGQRYYFRNIKWKGNSIYKDEQLTEVLGIAPGDIYNDELLQTRLNFSQDGRDINSLYMDNGYLFFRVTPVEVAIEGDSIDLEIRIYEGGQADIANVTISGNDRTHEHVIRRELRTKPGQKFSRSDIIRSQREIINLGYFNPESLGINTPVNQQTGTVDIEYTVEEKPSDQLELSAGWGGFNGVIGTLGVVFNNFSIKNIFNKEAWSPLPMGDGQRLSLRAQTNGRFYQSYNASFTEPWLGGKKPNSFTVGGYYTNFSNGFLKESVNFSGLGIGGLSVGLGTRLKWPDDFFVSSTTISFQNINLNNRTGFSLDDGTPVLNGSFNNISLNQTFSRNSIDQPLFPTSGAKISLSMQFTPPYSLLSDKNYPELPIDERFKFLEYHKWNVRAEWYATLFGKFVLKSSAKVGILGSYNETIGLSPFERFELGGDGISNFAGIQGKDIVSARGYEVEDYAANNTSDGTAAFNKFALEIRYPFSLNPSSTIYALVFAEGSNAYSSMQDYNPFDLKRSVGAGLRVFLPMFGTLGFDYGLGFDKNLGAGAKWSEYGNFNIILGFEPE
jgi:outer membrane protein insertion porin family